jgi:cytochrome P450
VDEVIARHRTSSAQKPADVLDTLSLDAWQTEFPLLSDQCFVEAIRLTMRGTPFRKNMGADLPLGDDGKAAEVIPTGAYGAYLVHHVHFGPEIYPDPEKFDPGRFQDDRAEHKKAPHAYLG